MLPYARLEDVYHVNYTEQDKTYIISPPLPLRRPLFPPRPAPRRIVPVRMVRTVPTPPAPNPNQFNQILPSFWWISAYLAMVGMVGWGIRSSKS